MKNMTWNDLEYRTVPITDAKLIALVAAFKSLYVNGKTILQIFRPTDENAFRAAYFNDHKGMEHILTCFLESESIRAAVPDLHLPYPLLQVPSYTLYGIFEFEGALSHLLIAGGAYVQSVYPENTAREMSRAFVNALVEERKLGVTVYRIEGAWTDWFFDVAWDSTFVVFDPHQRVWVILCATDTD